MGGIQSEGVGRSGGSLAQPWQVGAVRLGVEAFHPYDSAEPRSWWGMTSPRRRDSLDFSLGLFLWEPCG